MERKITIKEIAEKAEVSPGTVDRVLHNRGEVSPKTRKKVLAIVKEENYEPNIFARNLVLNKIYNIAAIFPQYQGDDYWAGPVQGVQQAAEELKALGIRNHFYLFEEGNAASFEQAAQEALASNPDGILLSPIIYNKAIWLATLCAKEDRPLVVVDSDMPDAQKLSFIGQNAFQSGFLAAKLLHIGGAEPSHAVYLVTIIKSTDNNDILKQRKKGFNAYFKTLSEKVQVNPVELHQEDERFDAKLDDFIKTLQSHDKLFIPNSKVHFIARGLKNKKKAGQVRMVGYDLIPKNLRCLKEGTIEFLINQKPEVQGYQGMQLFYKYLVLKQEVPQYIFMPLEIVTKENVDYVNF